MKEKLNVLLIGEANSKNLGDRVICKVGYAIFFDIYESNVYLFDISIAKRFLYRHNFLRKILKLFRSVQFFEYLYIYIILLIRYRNTKKIIFLGGALIKDYFINAINPVLRFSHLNGIPVRFLSIGYEKLSVNALRSFKKHVRLIDDIVISTRDNQYYLEENLKKTIKVTPDIALLTSQIYNIEKKSSNIIGVGCINPEVYYWKEKYPDYSKKYLKDMVDTINKISLLGYRIEIFTNGDPMDYEWAQKIFEQTANDNISLAKRPSTDVELVECIAKYDKIISARLHSLIIAYSFGIPTFCEVWNHKVFDFAKLTDNSNVIDLAEIISIDWKAILPKLKINDGKRKKLKDVVLEYASTI